MIRQLGAIFFTGSLVFHAPGPHSTKMSTKPIQTRQFTRSDCVVSGYLASGNYFESLFAIEFLRVMPRPEGPMKKVIDAWWPPICRGMEPERRAFTSASAALVGSFSETEFRRRFDKCRRLGGQTIEAFEIETIREVHEILDEVKKKPSLARDGSWLPNVLSYIPQRSTSAQLCANDWLKIYNIFNLELRAAVSKQPLWDDQEATQVQSREVADILGLPG